MERQPRCVCCPRRCGDGRGGFVEGRGVETVAEVLSLTAEIWNDSRGVFVDRGGAEMAEVDLLKAEVWRRRPRCVR